MNTEILPTHTPELFQQSVRRAAERLRAGELVALPTETVYGLAANALDEAAVAKIYQVKGRPASNPIIVHVADLAMARRCAGEWPTSADQLARAFWPGPLTLVLPRAAGIPDVVTAGGGTVGIRWPSHPFMQAVIRACDFPLAAPSANRSNRVSPTNAAHVHAQLHGAIPLIVDGGQSQVGIESTVVDLTTQPARVLRPGMIHDGALAAAGLSVAGTHAPHEVGALKSPGMLPKHYAPKGRLVVLQWQDEADLRAQLARLHLPPARPHIVTYANIPAGFGAAQVSVIPHDPEAFARALYGELHRCDETGVELIVVEAPPVAPEWAGIADRLRRAAA